MDRIFSVKRFQQQWCESGSKRLQHSAVLKHNESMSHEKDFDFNLKGPWIRHTGTNRKGAVIVQYHYSTANRTRH